MKKLVEYMIPAEDFIFSDKVLSGRETVCLFSKESGAKKAEIPLPPFPESEWGVKISLKLTAADAGKEACEVFAAELIKGDEKISSAPVQIFTAADQGDFRYATLESFFLNSSGAPERLFITRRCEDPGDTFQGTSSVAGVRLEFFTLPAPGNKVTEAPGYNSWPMCRNLNKKIICSWSRGSKHNIFEPNRAVFARVSGDEGVSWEEETLVCNTPGRGDVSIGTGLDEEGKMLLFVRHSGSDGLRHRLYRSSDGKKFDLLCNLDLPLDLVQITDVFHVPGVGLMALWFAGSYGNDSGKYWGKLVSADNGRTWEYTVVEKNLDKLQWPTEPSAVYLGQGRILVIARTESDENSTRTAQFQLSSTDYGRTWRKERTNITDVNISTPSLIYDPESEVVSCYYFYRGRGVLKCRRADAQYIFDNPLRWPDPETVTTGSCDAYDAGNVNAFSIGRKHFLAYYSGKMPHTAVYLKTLTLSPDEK